MARKQTSVYGDPCVQRHTAVIYDRGGKRRVTQVVDLTEVEWERAQDRKTLGSILVTGRACREQTAVLNQIEPRRHELVLFRGSERVWEGPILQTKSTSSSFRIDAADITEYLYGRSLSKAWPSPDAGGQPLMTERLREIITYELSNDYVMDVGDSNVTVPAWENLDPAVNILEYMQIAVGTTLTRSDTDAFEMSLGEHLYNLCRSIGVSFTTVGRRLVIWDGTLGRVRTVTEKDFTGDFEVIASGADFFNVSHVVSTSAGEGEAPAVGHASNDLDYYGPWERVIATSSEDPAATADQLALNSQARASIAHNYPVPISLIANNGTSLITSPGLTMAQLVAGTDIPVRAKSNLRDIKQLQRLGVMKVKETANGETISTDLDAA